MNNGSFQHLMESLVHRLTPALHRSTPVFGDTRVVVRKTEFQLVGHSDEPLSIPFDGVQCIFAHKRDLITTDLICFDLILRDGDVIEINEEMMGFDKFLDALDRAFDHFDRAWADKVVYPAFAANRTLVYAADLPPG